MLFSLISLLSFMCFCPSMAADPTLKAIVADAEKAAHIHKKDVDDMTANLEAVTTPLSSGGSCKVGECATFTERSEAHPKQSPLMVSKQPIIFVSASMPRASLKVLAFQATKHNAVLVIRGMVNGSMVETAKLVDEIDHPLDIDPKLFERFNIVKVPVFMVFHKKVWHKIAGNVELSFAVETAMREKVPS